MHPLFSKTWVLGYAAGAGGWQRLRLWYALSLSANTSKNQRCYLVDGVKKGHFHGMPQACHAPGHSPIMLPWTSSITWYWCLFCAHDLVGTGCHAKGQGSGRLLQWGGQFGKWLRPLPLLSRHGFLDPVNTARTSFTSGMSGTGAPCPGL